MSRPDAAASSALDATVIKPVFFGYLDIVGDPVRVCTAAASVQMTGTGDPDVDGQVFVGVDAKLIDISAVRSKSGGSNSVTARLSGIVGLDDDTLAQVGNRANWQGRTARLWRIIRNEQNVQQGGLQHYYTGYMVAMSITGSPGAQAINLTIESYLAAFSQASNRTYLDQETFDPGDLSARAAIAIANGVSGNPLTSNTGVGSGGKGKSLVEKLKANRGW